MQISVRIFVATAVVAVASLALSSCSTDDSSEGLPTQTAFDYQLGGRYEPAADVGIVVRDRSDEPEPDAYSICYVNAFQTQPGELYEWPEGAVLTDDAGEPVLDPDWPDEALLNISGAGDVVTERVGEWIRGCAADGFDAVELDNLDSFTRSDGALARDDAVSVAAELVGIAHGVGLAVGQKNAAEYASLFRTQSGFDFAISEECAAYDECVTYTEVYGDHVLNIEYTDTLPRTFDEMCADTATPASTILRDRDLATPDNDAYVREEC